MFVEGEDVALFLGRGGDAALVALAGEHALIVTAMARSYTRGRGFDVNGEAYDDVGAVITVATARLVSNPDQLTSETMGPFVRTSAPFTGWTLAETFVLNRYRRRAA